MGGVFLGAKIDIKHKEMGNSLEQSRIRRSDLRSSDAQSEPRTIELYDLLVSNYQATLSELESDYTKQ